MTPSEPRSVAVMYSGGTDSTYTAQLMAEQFDRVHLVTYRRKGMFNVESSDTNFRKLVDRWGEEKFVRPPNFPSVDKLFRQLSYGHYWRDLFRHGLFTLTTCGICKLAMHMRTMVYCLDNDVRCVRDGANQNMYIFPAQMPDVVQKLRDLYARYGIEYDNPVFEYADTQGMSFGSRLFGTNPNRPDPLQAGVRTTGTELYSLGILPSADVKGTAIDRSMQARCFQFVLFNVFARWYYLPRHSYEDYVAGVNRLYFGKISECQELLDEYVKSPESARLTKLVED